MNTVIVAALRHRMLMLTLFAVLPIGTNPEADADVRQAAAEAVAGLARSAEGRAALWAADALRICRFPRGESS